MDHTTKELIKMNLEELNNLTTEQLIEGICALECSIYTLESNGYSYSKEAQTQRQIKRILTKRAEGMAMSY